MEPNSPNPPEQPATPAAGNSLESPNGSLETGSSGSLEAAPAPSPAPAPTPASPSSESSTGTTTTATPTPSSPKPPRSGSPLSRLLGRTNIYLLVFILLLLVAGGVIAVVYIVGHSNGGKPPEQSQSLTPATLKQLANSDVTVGQPKQVLNVQSNAVFAGQVLVRSNLEVAGQLQLGGSLELPDITVGGTALFATTQVQKNLSVAGDSTLQGQLNVQKSLSVAGGATFGGAVSVPQLTASSLNLTGDLNLTHHISAVGPVPGRSNGGALGSGGSASVGGSDTAGSININTGSNAAAGCFVTITFTQKFNATPHVLVTPIGSAAAGLGYYVNRTSSNFSVCTTTAPPSGASFGFDYFVLD